MGNGGKWAWLQLGTHEGEGWVMRSRELDWVGKGWGGHAAGVGFVLWLRSGRGAGCGSGHRRTTGGVLPQPGPCKSNCRGPGKRAERCYLRECLQTLKSDMDLSTKYNEFVLTWAPTYTHLENTTLNERSPTRKVSQCTTAPTRNIQKRQIQRDAKQVSACQGLGEKTGSHSGLWRGCEYRGATQTWHARATAGH